MSTTGNLLIVAVAPDPTDDEILDSMREMKAARENPAFSNIVCLIDGFNDDPRELFQIPAVRVLCCRLVRMGFISYLDAATMLPFGLPTSKAWGAMEVWLCADGRMKAGCQTFDISIVDELKAVLLDANEESERTVGAPGKEPTDTKE